MRIVKQGAAFTLVVAWAMACAAPTGGTAGDGDGDGDGVGDGDAVPTGGTTASGGASTSTGGTGTGTGGTTSTTGGTTSTGGGTSGGTKTACQNGTITASATPDVLAWEVDGAEAPGVTGAAGPATATTNDGVAAILSTWAESGRECVNVSAFTGVQFDLTTDATSAFFKVGVSAADPYGHCSDADEAAGSCYANPVKLNLTPGTAIQIPFSELQTPGWGVMAAFNAQQVVSLIWGVDGMTTPADASKGLTVSNVVFY